MIRRLREVIIVHANYGRDEHGTFAIVDENVPPDVTRADFAHSIVREHLDEEGYSAAHVEITGTVMAPLLADDPDRKKKAIGVIIKGNMPEAVNAASERGMNLRLRHTRDGSTMGIIAYRHYSRVQSWFAEDAAFKAPFPIGSLLHYWTIAE